MPVPARPAGVGGGSNGFTNSRRPAGILLYGMYDVSSATSAPKVRIAMMTEALSRQIHTERIVGGRFGRAAASVRWLISGGPRRIGAVYVESATTSAMPTDLAFLAIMRLLRRPVGVYFRDAYQLFRGYYPRQRRRQMMSDFLWRVTTPLLKGVASRRFAASAGLARALGLRAAVVLGPGADPSLPDLGPGAKQLVAYVGGNEWADGFDLLLGAMAIVHETCPDAGLRLIGPALTGDRRQSLPPYVESCQSGRAGLAELLRDARVCVIPRPITAYSDLAVPVKLVDYLSFGKPVVATAAAETESILVASGAGIATPDTPAGLAEGLRKVLQDDDLAARLAAGARAYACSPEATWDARAKTVLTALGLDVAEPHTAALDSDA
jgi:glycosyltransferase involved in cell wall biosynthesis